MATRKKAKHRIAKRQAEAAERQSAHDALTIPQKIAKAKAASGESKRELSKLTKRART